MATRRTAPRYKNQGAYKVVMPGGFTGEKYFLTFVDGVAALCEDALEAGRPEWFDKDGNQYRGVPISEYVEYWERVGAKVTKLQPDAALKLYDNNQVKRRKLEEKANKAIADEAKPKAPAPAAKEEEPPAEDDESSDDSDKDTGDGEEKTDPDKESEGLQPHEKG